MELFSTNPSLLSSHFQEHLPSKPYCCDQKGQPLKIRPKVLALQHAHIQYNHNMIYWLVFDYDGVYDELVHKICDAVVPHPHFLVQNTVNQHCHVIYGLKAPVCATEMAHLKPLKYLANIEYTLGLTMGADEAYAGLIAKTPHHNAWRTLENVVTPLYELGDFEEWLGKILTRPARRPSTGLGRNVEIFDSTRYWAYRAVDKARNNGSTYLTWKKQVLDQAMTYNVFPTPLNGKEVESIARSVAKWVWNCYSGRWTDEEFSQIQAQRGKIGGKKGSREDKQRAGSKGGKMKLGKMKFINNGEV